MLDHFYYLKMIFSENIGLDECSKLKKIFISSKNGPKQGVKKDQLWLKIAQLSRNENDWVQRFLILRSIYSHHHWFERALFSLRGLKFPFLKVGRIKLFKFLSFDRISRSQKTYYGTVFLPFTFHGVFQ